MPNLLLPIYNEDDIVANLNRKRTVSTERMQEIVLEWVKPVGPKGPWYIFTIVKSPDIPSGGLQLTAMNSFQGTADLTIWIGRQYRRNHYATEAIKLAASRNGLAKNCV